MILDVKDVNIFVILVLVFAEVTWKGNYYLGDL